MIPVAPNRPTDFIAADEARVYAGKKRQQKGNNFLLERKPLPADSLRLTALWLSLLTVGAFPAGLVITSLVVNGVN